MSPDDSSHNESSLLSLALLFVVGLASALVFTVLGVFVGAVIGGNFAVDFQFAGNRGYEATGVLGAIIGFPVGAIIGVVVVQLCSRR